jgi:hypothetical protein
MPSNTAQNYEQLSYGGNASMHRGRHLQIISDGVATRTLVPKEAGSRVCYDLAAGVVYTLPPLTATNAGMFFEFFTTVSRTSNSHKVITSAATEFLLGAMSLLNNAATTGEAFAADGSTIRSVNGNGTTTGGIIGDCYRVVAYSATQWLVEGLMVQSGTAATPFATT